MDDKRSSLIAKIKALLAKTVANGATEAEAAMALAKASEMMEKYQIEETELDVRESEVDRLTINVDIDLYNALNILSPVIAELTNTRTWRSAYGKMTFVGIRHEVEIAYYMLDLCQNALNFERNRYLKTVELMVKSKRIMLVRSFVMGMGESLYRRIKEIINQRKSTGTALMVIRKDLIDAELKRTNTKLNDGGNIRDMLLNQQAYDLGVAAGEKVALNQGITQEEEKEKLNS